MSTAQVASLHVPWSKEVPLFPPAVFSLILGSCSLSLCQYLPWQTEKATTVATSALFHIALSPLFILAPQPNVPSTKRVGAILTLT